MSASGVTLAFQKYIYDLLVADTTLMGKVTGVFDFVPEDILMPYVVIGEVTSREWDTVTTHGQEQTLTIHTWSRYEGKKEMKDIMDDVYRVLQDVTGALTGGGRVVVLKLDYADDTPDPDGVTKHGVQRFRALLQGGS